MQKRKVAIIYKKSRFAFTEEKGLKRELKHLKNDRDTTVQDLIRAHENNLKCIAKVKSVVEDLGFSYEIICRSDLRHGALKNKFVISVGGDGTLLDTSHYCFDEPLLGVNSDPEQSIGALCIASSETVQETLIDILAGKLLPSPIARLQISIGGRSKKMLALNDVLYCNKNPAATSRYSISFEDNTESHRSSGVWIATPAGSTGGIYSSGGLLLPIEAQKAIFHVREPFWSDTARPELFSGSFGPSQAISIRSLMTDAFLYVDGPHKSFVIPFGESVDISLSSQVLWLFNGPKLSEARQRSIEQRRNYRQILKENG